MYRYLIVLISCFLFSIPSEGATDQNHMGQLVLTSTPDHMPVKIDGRSFGFTPLDTPLEAGRYTLEIDNTLNHQPFRKIIDVMHTTPLELHIDLMPREGTPIPYPKTINYLYIGQYQRKHFDKPWLKRFAFLSLVGMGWAYASSQQHYKKHLGATTVSTADSEFKQAEQWQTVAQAFMAAYGLMFTINFKELQSIK